MTFVGLDGKEKIKVGTSDIMKRDLANVSDHQQTWLGAEHYYEKLEALNDGEIWVSNVIGAYQASKIIGPYTPKAADKKGIPFDPEGAGYAGKENPVGKRFQGIVRWVTPVFNDGQKIGYVTLALDHTHIMDFTDHLVPTEERYSDISDAASGNYAFMWDSQGRNISHARDYFIVGYDPKTGEPEVPWLSKSIYDMWIKSKKSWGEFVQSAPQYLNPGSGSKASMELLKKGRVALDCRFLNFAPQCAGWMNLTQHGGSGSFVIFWSGLWKLTTAATIPYFTGQYGTNPRGFGFVTIGANVDEFHRAANESGRRLNHLIQKQEAKVDQQQAAMKFSLEENLKATTRDLSIYTILMIVIVIVIAIWIASFLTKRVTSIIKGINIFQQGDLDARLTITSGDELGKLANSFNAMADDLQTIIQDYDLARQRAELSDKAKTEFLANMSHELRTPLNAILGFSDVMRQESLGPISKNKYKTYANDIHHSGQHLLEVINDILDLARIESGHGAIEDETIDMIDVLDSSMRMVRERANAAGLKLVSDIPPSLPSMRGDSRRIKQTLLNLLSNAIKFTPNGIVTLLAETNNNSEFVVSVTDTGIGMSADDIRIALNPFGQVQSSHNRQYEGTGLGLSLSNAFVEMHDGRLDISSELGTGTKVTLTFPADRTTN